MAFSSPSFHSLPVVAQLLPLNDMSVTVLFKIEKQVPVLIYDLSFSYIFQWYLSLSTCYVMHSFIVIFFGGGSCSCAGKYASVRAEMFMFQSLLYLNCMDCAWVL